MSGLRALVAGATGPLGAATARRLADAGFTVAVHHRHSAGRAAAVLASLAAPERPHCTVSGDLLVPAAAQDVVAGAQERLGGPLDAVIDCAWPLHPSRRLVEEPGRVLEQSLDGVRMLLSLCRAAFPSLRRTAGSFVFLGGALERRRHPGLGYYSLGKSAATSACLTLALEEGAYGVRVNVVAPGRVQVEGVDLADTDPDFAALDEIAAQRRAFTHLPSTRDVADVATFLAGAASSSLTGQVLTVAGGEPA